MSSNMRRKTILWDMDDTRAHFVAPVLTELRRVMPDKTLQPEHMTDGAWLHDFLTGEELDAFLPYVFNPSFYSELEPTAIVKQRTSLEFINLQQAFDFHMVTARAAALRGQAHKVTSDWLHDQGIEVQGITICHPDQPKSQVFPSNAVAIVDDSGKVILDAASRGLECFLIDQPWNRHMVSKPGAAFHRVTQEEALAHVARILL
jgi:hypothetical protein